MKVIIVFRKLWKDEEKTIHEIIMVPKSVTAVGNWAGKYTDAAKQQMAAKFAEFGKAVFSYEVHELKEV